MLFPMVNNGVRNYDGMADTIASITKKKICFYFLLIGEIGPAEALNNDDDAMVYPN